jgi:hypothetical protein
MNKMLWVGAALAITLMSPDRLCAVTIGQVDDFEDGTTQNWVINLLGMGSPPPAALPKNVATGGPAGAGDNFLQLTSTGTQGAGGRLVAINFQNQWQGDFIAAGITGIRMDVQNLGQTDLYLRLLFADPVAGPPTNEAVSTIPILVPAGGGWRSVLFPVTPADLTANMGSAVAALTNSTEFRIYNNRNFGQAPPIAASLGVDNITASAIPEPSTFTLLATALASVVAFRKRRK